jgi:dephospho-CoA kinase
MFTRIGLTGGIGAGKSTIAQHLVDEGYFVIDYDELAHRVVEPGTDGLRQVVEYFGPHALKIDGSMNREWIASQIFDNQTKRDALDDIIHPMVFDEAMSQERDYLLSPEVVSASPSERFLVFHEIPLLVESHSQGYFDRIITVEAPPRIRMNRLVELRGMSLADAATRIDSQASEDERRSAAQNVIDSTQPIELMFEQVDKIIQEIKGVK